MNRTPNPAMGCPLRAREARTPGRVDRRPRARPSAGSAEATPRRVSLRGPAVAVAAVFLLMIPARAAASAQTTEPAELSTELQRTIITSDRGEGRNDGVEAYFVFDGNVHLTGTNLDVTCDKLEVWADTAKGGRDVANTSDVGPIRRVLATGRVVIRQQGRAATAGRVEVLPGEDIVILTEDPVVTDATAGTMGGDRITFHRGDQHIEISNPRVVMRALPNMGFSPKPGEPADASAPAPQEPAGEAQPQPPAP